jgi:hypothetical protein
MYKYLLFDDDSELADVAITLTATAKQHNIPIEVVFLNPTEISLKDLSARFKNNDFDGLVTDHRLDGEDTKPNEVEYRGTSLAQNIRTLSNEGKIKEFPIVLYYAPERSQISLFQDAKGMDLFDLRLNKDDVTYNDYPKICNELFALSKGYSNINDSNLDIYQLLGLIAEDLIDDRIVDILKRKKKSVHELAMFIQREVIFTSGILIDDDVLAARLGVDKSCADWSTLKEYLQNDERVKQYNICYTGIFSTAWERYWNTSLSIVWKAISGKGKSLSTYNATERVEILNLFFTLNLKPAKLSLGSYSDCFWTVCAKTKKPIDAIDGILTNRTENFFWQDTEYVCKEFVHQNKAWIDFSSIEKNIINKIHSIP